MTNYLRNAGELYSDNLNKCRPQNASKVNVHELYEVESWTKKSGGAKEQLESAGNAVGTDAAAIENI